MPGKFPAFDACACEIDDQRHAKTEEDNRIVLLCS